MLDSQQFIIHNKRCILRDSSEDMSTNFQMEEILH